MPKNKKKTVKKQPAQVPEGLEVFIENTVKAAFPELQNINNLIKVTGGYLEEVDYQFNLKPITSKLNIEPNEVLEKIKAHLQENSLLNELKLSSNSLFINIYTSTSRQKPCDSCSLQLKLKLGKQSITFTPGEKSIYTKAQEWINDELTRQLLKQMSQLSTSDQGSY